MEQPQTNNKGNVDNRPTNGLAIAALICAILVPIVGLILGIIALSQLKKDTSHKGRGLAIAAIIVSIALMLLLVMLMFIGMVAYFGVLSPNKLLPDRAVFQAPLPNTDNAQVDLNQGTIEVPFRNNKGVSIRVLSTGQLSIKGSQCSNLVVAPSATSDISNGALFLVKWSCPELLNARTVGSRLSVDLTFNYINVETGMTIPHSGSVDKSFGYD